MRAREIMTSPVRSIPADATLHELATLLAEANISGVPVVEGDGSVVGVVSEKDLLEHAQSFTTVPRLTLHRFGFGALPPRLREKAYADGLSRRVREIMRCAVVSADEDTPLVMLADRMVRHRINRIPIVRGDKVVGIVTREDLMRALAAHG
jgi:CBS domain-containing protein